MSNIHLHSILFFATICLLAIPSSMLQAQEWKNMNRVKAKFRVVKPIIQAKAGEKIFVEVEVEPFEEWYIYSVKERNGVPATMLLLDMTVAEDLPPTKETPPPTESYDEAFDDEAFKHYKQVTFTQVITLKKKLRKGKYNVEMTLQIQTCNNTTGQCVKDEMPIRYELVVK